MRKKTVHRPITGRRRKIEVSVVAAIASLIVAPFAMGAATPITWTGGSSASFDNAANWLGGVAPTNDLSTNIATFSGTLTINQPTLTSTRSIGGLAFTTATGGWTLLPSGARVLSVGGSGISTVGQTSGIDTISANIGVGSTQIWQAGTGGTLDITGVVSGTNGGTLSLGVASTGNGTIILGNTNVFALAGVNIAAGTVQLAAAGALGSVNNNLNGSSGALLDFNDNNAGVNSLSGSFSIVNNGVGTATLTIGSNNGSGTFSGSISNNNNGNGGVVALVKTGTGQEVFNTANSYSGGTTILSGGTANDFRVSNLLALGSGTVTLSGGQFHPITTTGTYANAFFATTGTTSSFDGDAGNTFSGVFTGSGTILFHGNSANTLSGDLTGFNGTFDIEYGINNPALHATISLTNATTIGDANGAFVLANGSTALFGVTGVPTGTQTSTLQWAGTGSVVLPLGSLAGGPLGILQNATAGSTATFQIGALGTSTAYAGTIQNGGGGKVAAVAKVGIGTLSLFGANTYTGITTIDVGTVNVAWLSLATPTLSVVSGSTSATVSSAAGLVAGEPISAAGIITGTTIASLSGTNITLSAASTALETNTATQIGGSLGSTATAAGLVFGGGTLQYTGGVAQSSARLFAIGDANGNAATIDASGNVTAAMVTFSNTGAIAFANATAHSLNLTGSNTGSNVLAPTIGDQSSGNATSLTKTGGGTWVLSGANTYSGGTSVVGGTLALTGAGTAGTGTISVSAGARLDASGTTAGALSLSPGQALKGLGNIVGDISVSSGEVALDDVTGALTNTGNTTFSAGSTFVETIDSTAGVSGVLAVSGSLALSGTLTIADLNPGSFTGSYTLATYGGSLSGAFTTTLGLPAGYQVDYSQVGTVLIVAPEPASFGVMFGLLSLQSLWRRRRGASFHILTK